jgi:hypothetical protein
MGAPKQVVVPNDKDESIEAKDFDEKDWALAKTVELRLYVAKAMVWIFAGLNVAIVILIIGACLADVFHPAKSQLITEKVIMALIAGTVAQAGAVMFAMARHVFPNK